MKVRLFGMLIASLGVFATMLTSTEAFAGSHAVFAPKFHRFGHGFRHHHRAPTVVVADDLKLTNAQAGLLASLVLVTWSLSGFLGGNFADKSGKRKQVIINER